MESTSPAIPAATGQGPPEIDPDEISLEHVIGDGAFGTVYRGRCRQKDVAVKVLFKQFDEQTLSAFRKEVEIMSKISHPNVSLFMGACTSTPGKLMICNELLVKDVETLLMDQQVPLTLLLRMRMARDAALGMLWLHGSNPVIVHRDLKTSNLLVDQHFHVKVCDFGLSQIKARGVGLMDSADGAKGTPLWMAPEILMGHEFDERADVYSFGLVLWQMLTREDIFAEYDNLSIFIRDICKRNIRPPMSPDTNPKLATLIRRCWHQNPTQRPSFSQIVTLIDEVILDLSIHDEAARVFWKGQFGTKEQVTWREFVNAYAVACKLVPERAFAYDLLVYQPQAIADSNAEINFKCLKALLVSNAPQKAVANADQQELVSMEQFGNIVAWFGDWATESQIIPHKIRELLQQSWFHGDITTEDAESRLMYKPEGTFLVRFSSSEPGAFTISKVSMFGSISHQRIAHSAGQNLFVVGGNTYRTLQDLVAGERETLNLLSPCPGTRFLVLFARANVQGYIS
eukprot:m51a1_g14637 putative sh2 domain-containing protein (514) ;mRNA; r:41786-44872